MAEVDPFPLEESCVESDSGAFFFFLGSAKWWHTRFYLTMSSILMPPYAFSGLIWALGFFCLGMGYYLKLRLLRLNHGKNVYPSKLEIKNMMTYQLPEEIYMEILERLPIKSLIRFKTVCKSWKSLISTPCFIDRHFSRSAANSNKVGIALTRKCKDGPYCKIYFEIINLSPTSLGETTTFIEHVVTGCQEARPLGWCRGLLLLGVDCSDCKLLLSNPSTRESKEIPDPPYRRLEFEKISSASAFGYDFNIKSHKIVLIYELGNSEYCIWVYTLKTNLWTCVDLDTDHKYAFYDLLPITLVNGAPHWVIIRENKVGVGARHAIEYFDFAVSKFVVIPQPGDYDNRKIMFTPLLYDTEGSLCIVYRIKAGFNFEIWVMKRYGVKESWLKWMSFENEYVPYPICFGKNNINVSLVVARGDQGERCFAIYNGKEKKNGTRIFEIIGNQYKN